MASPSNYNRRSPQSLPRLGNLLLHRKAGRENAHNEHIGAEYRSLRAFLKKGAKIVPPQADREIWVVQHRHLDLGALRGDEAVPMPLRSARATAAKHNEIALDQLSPPFERDVLSGAGHTPVWFSPCSDEIP